METCIAHPNDDPDKPTADESAIRRALMSASNYIDTLGGDSRPYRAALASAPVADERAPVAYLDLGTGGYVDVGTDLNDEQLAALPKGRHMLAIIGTHGVNGYTPASAPVADSWQPPDDDWDKPAADEIRALRAARASTHVADNWRQYALPGETTAEQVCGRMNAEVTRRTVASMRASAPVADERELRAAAQATCDALKNVARFTVESLDDRDALVSACVRLRAALAIVPTAKDAMTDKGENNRHYNRGYSAAVRRFQRELAHTKDEHGRIIMKVIDRLIEERKGK